MVSNLRCVLAGAAAVVFRRIPGSPRASRLGDGSGHSQMVRAPGLDMGFMEVVIYRFRPLCGLTGSRADVEGSGVVSGLRFGWVSIWSLAVLSRGGIAPEGSLRLRHGIEDWVAAHTTLG